MWSVTDSAELGLKNNDQALLTSRRNEILTKVVLTDAVDAGTVFMSFHFMEANANVLTNPALDSIAKIPELVP